MRFFCLFAGWLLIFNLFSFPFWYDDFIRVFVTVLSAFIFYFDFTKNQLIGLLTFALITLLFNPLFPLFTNNQTIWKTINVLTGGVFLWKAYNWNKRKKALIKF